LFFLLLVTYAKADTYINSCQELNISGETYYLTQDIINYSPYPPPYVCMNITANNIVLDCQGYTIDGVSESNTEGIYAFNRNNITVKNCIVSDFVLAIDFGSNSYYCQVINSVAKTDALPSGASGAIIGSNSNVFNSTFYNSTVVIWGNNNNVSYNKIENLYENGDGIFIAGSENIIYNNLINSTVPVYFYSTNLNYWNTARQTGTRIYTKYYGNEIGGNYWGKPDGTGYSDTCNDKNWDGFCDNSYTLATNNIDYLPLSIGVSQEDALSLHYCMLSKDRVYTQDTKTWIYKLRNENNKNWYCYAYDKYSGTICYYGTGVFISSFNCSQMNISSSLPRPLNIGERWEIVLPPRDYPTTTPYHTDITCYNVSGSTSKDYYVFDTEINLDSVIIEGVGSYKECVDNVTLAILSYDYTTTATYCTSCSDFISNCCLYHTCHIDCSPGICYNNECTSCNCTDWTAGGCYNTTHRIYTRSCSPSGCDIEMKYETDPSCMPFPWLDLFSKILSPFWIVLLMIFAISTTIEKRIGGGGLAFLIASTILLFVFSFLIPNIIPIWLPVILIIIIVGFLAIRR